MNIGRALIAEFVATLEGDQELCARLRSALAPRQAEPLEKPLATGSECMSTRECAQSVRRSVHTVLRAIASGELEAVRMGRDYLIERSARDAWVASKRGRRPIKSNQTAARSIEASSPVPSGFAHLVATGQVRLVR